jgi:hypothetical protein
MGRDDEPLPAGRGAAMTTTPEGTGHDQPPVYRLTLLALPGEVAPAQRLKALLKRALRSFGLKALDVREVRGEESVGGEERR